MGGGAPSETTSTVTQSNLPEYAAPYYNYMMKAGINQAKRPYQPYKRPRLAEQNASTLQGLSQADRFGSSGLGFLPQAQGVASDLSQYQAGNFDAAARDQYMSPYMDAVTDHSKRMAVQDAMQNQMYNDTEAAASGAFGGSRAALMKAVNENGLMDRLTGITVQGRQGAFENAQQQFERDRNAGFQSAGIRGNAANQLAEFQGMQDNMQLQRIQSLLGAGQAREDYNQQKLDLAYQDFINQRDAPRQNLQFLSSLLQGVPISANSNTMTSTPTNPVAGALGTMTGLQALYALGRSG